MNKCTCECSKPACKTCAYWHCEKGCENGVCWWTDDDTRFDYACKGYVERDGCKCTRGCDKWIPLNEGLPRRNVWVLVRGGKYIPRIAHLSSCNDWFSNFGRQLCGVTHWMEIPEAPDEKCNPCPETRECGNCCHWKGDDYTSFRNCTSSHYDARILGTMETARSHSCGWWEAIEECRCKPDPKIVICNPFGFAPKTFAGNWFGNRLSFELGTHQGAFLLNLDDSIIRDLARWLNRLWASHGTQ